MKRTLFAVIVGLAMASSGGAATLTLQAQGGGSTASTTPGGSVVLELVATAGGEVDTGVFAALVADNNLVSFVGASQVALTSFGGAAPWAGLTLSCLSAQGDCWAINQANPNPLGPFPVDGFNGVIATIDMTAGLTLGTTVVSIGAIPGNTLNFFGVTPGQVGTVSIDVVPEPTTAGLMAIGMIGLALAGRRRR